MQVMSGKDDINKLQAEADELARQLQQYQQRVSALQQQLRELRNENTSQPVQSTSSTTTNHRQLENFIGLRLIHLVGIVILVIGLSIGVKYAIDRNLVSEGMRIILAYLAGAILYFFSLRLRKNYAGFSAILFSGAMASLYFTTYGAFVYYGFFSFIIAFVVMMLLTIYTVYEAIQYNRQEIALLGLVGAYAIPFLISRNNERADLFFLYISFINSAVVFLSIKKLWRTVGKVAHGITWLLFIGWAALRFDVKWQGTGFSFMAFFFLLFLFNSIAPKIFNNKKLNTGEAYATVANNLALYIAALFVFGYTFKDADIPFVTFIVSMMTALLAISIHFLCPEEESVKRILAGLALSLFIIFIAFNWEGITVTLLWLLTSVIIFSIGVYRKSVPLRMTAIVVVGITLLKLLVLDSLSFSPVQKIIAYVVLGILLLVISFFYQKFKKQLFGDAP